LWAEAIEVLLHTYGTVAVMTDVEVPVTPAHTWFELGAAFEDFDHASAFCWNFARMTPFRKRLLSMEAAPIPSFFPVRRHYQDGDNVALLIVEAGQHAQAMSV